MARARGKRVSQRPIGNPAHPDGLATMMARHCEWLETAGYAAQTIEQRERFLSRFLRWADMRAIRSIHEVNRPIMERYQRHLFHHRKANGDPLSFAAQKARLIPLRIFFGWLARYHHIEASPAADLQLPKVEQRLPKAILTPEEMEQVLALPDLAKPLGIRDRTIMETLYSTGVRRSELTHLKIFDLDHERQTLIVQLGKGKKDRIIPIGSRALAWIEKYLTEVRPLLAVGHDEGWIFLTDDGHSISPDHLSGLVSRYIKAADLGKTGSCHLFRHSMATAMLENGADLRFIQAMLGHSDIASTTIYTRVAIKQLQRVYETTHPGALVEPEEEAE